MKTFGTIMKIVLALAAIAGAIYLAATYGERIVAWAKNLINRHRCFCNCDGDCCCEDLMDTPVSASDADFEG